MLMLKCVEVFQNKAFLSPGSGARGAGAGFGRLHRIRVCDHEYVSDTAVLGEANLTDQGGSKEEKNSVVMPTKAFLIEKIRG